MQLCRKANAELEMRMDRLIENKRMETEKLRLNVDEMKKMCEKQTANAKQKQTLVEKLVLEA